MTTLVCRDQSKLPTPKAKTVATLGSFDGVHLGHQQLFQRLAQLKRSAEYKDARIVVLTFYPHPGVVLHKAENIPLLTTLRQKREVLSGFNVDILYLMHFTKSLSTLSMEQFIDQVLIKILHVDALVVGQDARIGRGGEGTAEKIIGAVTARGIKGEIVSLLDKFGAKIGSRRIRDAVEQGDVSLASQLLGRPFALDARVVHGDKRGTSIGFPTANLIAPGQLVPAGGVYACKVVIRGKVYQAVTNIGTRPTFGGGSSRVECHILDFSSSSLYGQRLSLEFMARVRSERKFSNVEDLKKQIGLDIEQARIILASGN